MLSNLNLKCDGFPKTSFLLGMLKSCIPQWEKAVIYTTNPTRRNNLPVLNDITDLENNVKIMKFELKVFFG